MSRQYVLVSKKEYKNGCRIKHQRNRAVTVTTGSKDKEVIVEMARADCGDEINKPACVSLVHKGKVRVTGIKMTELAAMALFACLQDYFERVVPSLNTTP